MANRIEAMIARYQGKINSKIIEDPGAVEKLDKQMSTSFSDLVQYQNLQALAHASGKITTDEAQLVYRLLGGEAPSEEKWAKLSLAEKVTITQLMSELLDWKISLRSPASRPKYSASGSKKQRKHGKPDTGLGGMR